MNQIIDIFLGMMGNSEIISSVLRIALSIICGGVLGIEHGRENQPAGMRTYMLVSLGATIVMLTG